MEKNTKGERRDKKRLSKRRRMQQHGKGLARIYREAILKRFRRKNQS